MASRSSPPRRGATSVGRKAREVSPQQLAERVRELEVSERETKKTQVKEQKQRQKELNDAKKKITKELQSASRLVQRGEREAGKLATRVDMVEKQAEQAKSKQARQLAMIEDSLGRMKSKRNGLEATLQDKMSAVGEAKGRLAHVAFAAKMLEAGVVVPIDGTAEAQYAGAAASSAEHEHAQCAACGHDFLEAEERIAFLEEENRTLRERLAEVEALLLAQEQSGQEQADAMPAAVNDHVSADMLQLLSAGAGGSSAGGVSAGGEGSTASGSARAPFPANLASYKAQSPADLAWAPAAELLTPEATHSEGVPVHSTSGMPVHNISGPPLGINGVHSAGSPTASGLVAPQAPGGAIRLSLSASGGHVPARRISNQVSPSPSARSASGAPLAHTAWSFSAAAPPAGGMRQESMPMMQGGVAFPPMHGGATAPGAVAGAPPTEPLMVPPPPLPTEPLSMAPTAWPLAPATKMSARQQASPTLLMNVRSLSVANAKPLVGVANLAPTAEHY